MTNEQLVLRIKAGEDVANNMLQLYHQMEKAIAKIAYNYRNLAELEDLQQEGYIGLCKAVDAYKPESGVLFVNYAWKCIEWHISRYIAENNPLHIPAHMYDSIRKYKRFFRAFMSEHHRNPSENEIRHFMGLDTEQVAFLLKCVKMGQIDSLNRELDTEDGGTVEDFIADDTDIESDVLDDVLMEQMRTELWEVVDSLPEEQSLVIQLRYKDGMTLEQIQNTLGMTQHKVRSAEEKGKRNLRTVPEYTIRIQPFADALGYYSGAYYGSVGSFNRTWTSSTERVALEHLGVY